MIFIDTNYFLRFLIEEDRDQHLESKKLFIEASEGKIKAFTSVIVFFEIYWVLSSFYDKKKEETVKILRDILNMEFITWENKKEIREAVELFSRKGIELEDAYNLMYALKNKARKVKSFDKKFNRVWEEARDIYKK